MSMQANTPTRYYFVSYKYCCCNNGLLQLDIDQQMKRLEIALGFLYNGYIINAILLLRAGLARIIHKLKGARIKIDIGSKSNMVFTNVTLKLYQQPNNLLTHELSMLFGKEQNSLHQL